MGTRSSAAGRWRSPVPFESEHEVSGREVAVVREEGGPGNRHVDVRLEFGGLASGQQFGCQTQAARLLDRLGLVVQRTLGAAQHEQPLAREAEAVALARGQFLEQGAAGEVQLAQEGRRLCHAPGGRRAAESPSPTDEVPTPSGLEVERGFGVAHPSERQRHHARRRQRDEVARHDEAGIAERAAIARRRLAFQHDDPMTSPATEIGRAEADEATADDDNRAGLHAELGALSYPQDKSGALTVRETPRGTRRLCRCEIHRGPKFCLLQRRIRPSGGSSKRRTVGRTVANP